MPAESPRSIWASSAHPLPAGHPGFPALSGDLQVDVAIVGGGFTGLSAAHHLCGRGVATAVLEANDFGWGASGRNGGMAVPRYKTPWATLARRHGDTLARQLHRWLFEAIDALEAAASGLGIDGGFHRPGHLTAANGRAAVAMLEADLRWLASIGDRTPRLIDAAETARLAGTGDYLCGYLDPRAAGIHPLNHVRGMAIALAARGVPLFAHTPAVAVHEHAQGVVLSTPAGSVRAHHLLLATNAYSDLFRLGNDLHRRVVPVSTSVVTTGPLPAAQLAALLPEGHLVSDTRHLLNYWRIAPGGRLLYGGRGSLTGREAPAVYAGLERRLVETFPALAGVPVDHRWSGKVAVTMDDFPHVGRIGRHVSYALGYGGRGVALSHLLGRLAAHLALGEAIDAGPMGGTGFGPVPLHALRIPGMKAVAGYYRVLDALKV